MNISLKFKEAEIVDLLHISRNPREMKTVVMDDDDFTIEEVVAVAEAERQSGGNGVDVLENRGILYSVDVVGYTYPERLAA